MVNRDKAQADAVVASLARFWSLTDLDEPQQMLSIRLSSTAYINQLANQYDLTSARSGKTAPLPASLELKDLLADEHTVVNTHDHHTYRDMVGKMLWLSMSTRLDLAFPPPSSRKSSILRLQRLSNSLTVLLPTLTTPRRRTWSSGLRQTTTSKPTSMLTSLATSRLAGRPMDSLCFSTARLSLGLHDARGVSPPPRPLPSMSPSPRSPKRSFAPAAPSPARYRPRHSHRARSCLRGQPGEHDYIIIHLNY